MVLKCKKICQSVSMFYGNIKFTIKGLLLPTRCCLNKNEYNKIDYIN